MNFSDIKLLQKLIKTENEGSDSDDDIPKTSYSKLGPGNIGPKKKEDEDKNPPAKDPNEIWDEDQVNEVDNFEENDDPRTKPEYDIKFRQAVTPEDVYLQMGGKTPSSSSCEDLVITVYLNEESKDKIDLCVQSTRIDIRSPLYRLGLPLPHPVDPNSGNAKWDEDKKTLTITLRMEREFDFINF